MSDENKIKVTGRPTKSKRRPLVPKSQLWTRDERVAMAKLAQDFLDEAKSKATG
jgi:hypothetical protein